MDVRAVDELARQQHGLLSASQARSILGESRTQRWAAEGRLIRVQPRTYRLAGAPRTWVQELRAAQMATGGLVAHRAAAEVWGLRAPEGAVEIAVEARRGPQLRPPAVLHRIVDLAQARASAVERDGLQVTDPVRTILDLGLVVPATAVADALDAALGRRLLSVDDVRRLRQELSRCGRNGVGVVGKLLDGRWPATGHVESVLEAKLIRLLRSHGLPQPVVQHEVWEGGRFVARIDVAFPPLLLAIEVDGFQHHSSPEAFQRDRSRQNELVALGWTVLRFTWDDVVRRPDAVASAIRAAIRRQTDSLQA